ncbi:MAG: glycosyltransferase [Oscillospiraceae bacterium]|nr:glycosyltransferase [Oscillospiraceae bacterium]
MSQNPLFSIIIPIYNTEKELPRCVDSVLAQTFEDFELVLVDDGSKDGSGAICDAYAARDARVKVFHKKNGGSSSARNLGIEKATGDYLLFLDSDDYWSGAEALSDLADQINTAKNETDVICFGTILCRVDGSVIKTRKPDPLDLSYTDKFKVLQHLIYTNQYFSAAYVKAVRRGFVLQHNLFFRNDLTSGEDIEWSANVMVFCKSINVYSNAFYIRVRGREGAITSSIGEKNVLDVLSAIETGIALVEKQSEIPALKDLYLEYWAYQYAMLLGLANELHRFSSYPSIYRRIKDLKWLLKYDHEKKVRAVHLCVAAIGLRAAMNVMRIYYRM